MSCEQIQLKKDKELRRNVITAWSLRCNTLENDMFNIIVDAIYIVFLKSNVRLTKSCALNTKHLMVCTVCVYQIETLRKKQTIIDPILGVQCFSRLKIEML